MLLWACGLLCGPWEERYPRIHIKAVAARVSHPCIPRLTPHRRLAPILSYLPSSQTSAATSPTTAASSPRSPGHPPNRFAGGINPSWQSSPSSGYLGGVPRELRYRTTSWERIVFDREKAVIGQGNDGSSIPSFLPWWDLVETHIGMLELVRMWRILA
jgi:hypothetical protein